MKKCYWLIVSFLFIGFSVVAQIPKGTVINDSIYSQRLENNYGESPTRAVSVYLPPAYDESTQHYPVIYFLHGFTGDNKVMDYIVGLLDQAITTHRIRPFIMVIPDEKTSYDGSFYSNSELFGNWEDFTAFDLVNYMDKKYRTIADKDSRGITGHSMGGYGALKIAMHHPDIFSSVYALSPGVLTIVRNMAPTAIPTRNWQPLKRKRSSIRAISGKSLSLSENHGPQIQTILRFTAICLLLMKVMS